MKIAIFSFCIIGGIIGIIFIIIGTIKAINNLFELDEEEDDINECNLDEDEKESE